MVVINVRTKTPKAEPSPIATAEQVIIWLWVQSYNLVIFLFIKKMQRNEVQCKSYLHTKNKAVMFTGSALPFYRIERCALRAAGAIVASFQVMACFIT